MGNFTTLTDFLFYLATYYPNQTYEATQQYPAAPVADAQVENQQLAGQFTTSEYYQGAAQWETVQTEESSQAQGNQQPWDASQAGGQQQSTAALNPEQMNYDGSYMHYGRQTSQGKVYNKLELNTANNYINVICMA